MSEAGPQLDARVLAALREEAPPPDGVRERARARLGGLVPVAATAGPSPATSGAPTLPRGFFASNARALFAFALGGLVGAGLHAAASRSTAARVIDAPPTAAVPLEAPPVVVPAPSHESTSPPADPPRPVAANMASPKSSHPPLGRPSQLAAERVLLDDARAALGQGNAEGALAKLDESRRTYARAILDEERQALTVEALVAARRSDDARAAAVTFRKLFPGSVFTPTVDGAIRTLP